MPFIVATYVYASSQGQRTHSARTNFNSAIPPLEEGLMYFKFDVPIALDGFSLSN